MIMNKITRHFNLICLVMLVLLLLPAQAQEVKKITVLPFEIYTKENKSAIQEALYRKMIAELQKEKQLRVVPADSFLRSQVKINEGSAVNAGRSLMADFVVMGSLTKLGESISVDAKVINVRSGKALSPIFVQGKGLESLDDIAAQLKTDVLVQTGLVEKIAKVEISGNNKIEAVYF